MNFDLRLPIGLLFTAYGLLLTLYGLLTPKAMYQASLGLNINFAWGLVLLAFGGLMLGLAIRGLRAGGGK